MEINGDQNEIRMYRKYASNRLNLLHPKFETMSNIPILKKGGEI